MSQAEVRMRVSAKDDASGTIKKIQREMYGLKSGLDNFGRSAMALGTVGIVGLFTSMASSSLDAYLQLEKLNRAYTTIGGSTGAAVKQLEFIRSETERLGLSFVDSAEQAKGFFASVKGTVMGGEVGQGIFTGVSEAGASLGLSAVDMDRAFRALGQIASKGKVMAEELRGQLGEVVPGAFQIAARAMGMTTAELDKFMADGKLLAEDFLPRLGKQFTLEFADGAEKASHTVQASINRMSSSWTEFKANILNSDSMMSVFGMVNNALSSANASTKEYRDKQSLIKGMEESGYAKHNVLIKSFDASGGIIEQWSKGYSDAQIEKYKESQKQFLAEQAKADAVAAQAEKTLGENRKRINESYAKSAQGQRQTLLDEHTQTLQSFDGMIADYQRQGTDTSSLLSQRAAVVEEYKKKLAGLDKKNSAPSTASADTARRSLEALRAEMDKLSGAGSSVELTLTKKFNEIEKLGIAAKMGGPQIADLKDQYANVFQVDVLRRFDDELIKLSGDAKAIQFHEITRQTEEWRKQFEALVNAGKMGTDEAALRVGNMRSALENKVQIKDAESAASFYKELGDLSGSYGLSIQHQNELLRLQADNLVMNVGISRELAGEWLRLKRLEFARDPMSGLERGMRKYVAEATDYASQFESVWTGAMTSFEDSIVRAMTTGKLSFSDLANSIIADMARMTVKQSMGGIVGGIGNLIGGLFTGGNPFGGAYKGGVQTVPRPPVGASHGGGIIGFGQYSSVVSDDPRLYANAPRYHDGYGLKADERRAILQTGETVLSRTDTAYFKNALKNFDATHYRPPMRPQFAPAQAAPSVVNNFTITPPSGYEAQEERKPNNQGGEDIRVTFSRMMAAEVGTYGSPLNKALRTQGSRQPVMRKGG